MTASDTKIRPYERGDHPALEHIRQAAFAPVFLSFREIVGAEIAAIAFAHADTEQARLLDDVCAVGSGRSEEHTSELHSRQYLVCRLLLEKKLIYLASIPHPPSVTTN